MSRPRDADGRFVKANVDEESSSEGPEVPSGNRHRIVVDRPARPLKPSQCRDWLRRAVARALPDVVEGFLNEAVKGGCAHLKMAADTVSSRAPVKESKPKGKGSAALLLEELDRELGLD